MRLLVVEDENWLADGLGTGLREAGLAERAGYPSARSPYTLRQAHHSREIDVAAERLEGCRVLVAEDEYFLATDTAGILQRAGATVVGPIGDLAQVEEQARRDGFDVAVLDIRLDEELVYPAADLIRQAGVPIAFLTGYESAAIPVRFADVPHCQKPCPDEAVIDMVRRLCS